ncbi:MAG TPA: hypothetical protein VIV11_19745 [Kofleriaceae bacterium]
MTRGLGLLVVALFGCDDRQRDAAYGEIVLDHEAHLEIPPLYYGFSAIGRVVDSCPEGAHEGCDTQTWKAVSVGADWPIGMASVLPDGTFEIWSGGAGEGRVVVEAMANEGFTSSPSLVVQVLGGPTMPDAPPPMPTPDLCATAPAITAGTHAGDTTTYLDNSTPPGQCTNGFSAFGGDAFYRVDLTAGQMVTATVTPSGWDAMLYVIEGCMPSTCTAGADAGGPGAPETTTFTAPNDGPYHLVVDSPSQAQHGAFTLVVTIQ